MQAAQITGGRVIYGRTVKTGDYENKRVDVELTFSTPEGQSHDETFAVVCEQVLLKAHAMLGITEKSNVVALRPAATNGATQPTDKDRLAAAAGLPADAKTETKAGDPPAPTTTRKTRAAKPPAVAEDPAAIGGDPAPKSNGATDPAAIGETQLQANASDAADLEDDLLTGSAPEVTDEVLTTAITKKNASVKNPVAIRALIGRYTPQDGNAHQAREIEQSKRAAFITELETIKPLV